MHGDCKHNALTNIMCEHIRWSLCQNKGSSVKFKDWESRVLCFGVKKMFEHDFCNTIW